MKTFVIAASLCVVAAVGLVWFVDPAKPRGGRSPRSADEVASARVDKLFARWDRRDSPGCSVGVSRNGVQLYARGYGMADVELGVPLTPASVFHVASIAKQFTAMSILLLAKRGALSLDDEVWKYVPEWRDREHRVTIRTLLTHTSGIRDAFVLRSLAAPRDEGPDLNEEVVRILARQRGVNFTPGSEFQYSNSGYTLLGSIVTRVSGQSLHAFEEANIFGPLGMAHTHVHDDPTVVVPNRTSGYHLDAGSVLRRAPHADLGRLVGTTGLFTTVPDLLVWEQNFANPRVGDAALVRAMQTPAIEAPGLSPTGGTTSYGFGLEIGDDHGLRTIGHGGGDPGYAAYVARYLDEDLAVAVLCNIDNAGVTLGQVAMDVANAYLERDARADAARGPREPREAGETGGADKTTAVVLSAEQLASRAGLYRNPATGAFGRIFVRDGKLMAVPNAGEDPSVELTPVSTTRFVVRGTAVTLEFVPSADGRTQELHLNGAGAKPAVMQLVPAFAPSPVELRAFAGSYTSAELEVIYTISARGTELVAQIPGRREIVLRPIAPGTFYGPVVDVVEFSRDARGTVTGFAVKTDAVRNLRFDRTPH